MAASGSSSSRIRARTPRAMDGNAGGKTGHAASRDQCSGKKMFGRCTESAFDRWSASLPPDRSMPIDLQTRQPADRRTRVGKRAGNRHPTAPYLRHADHSRLGPERVSRPLLRSDLGGDRTERFKMLNKLRKRRLQPVPAGKGPKPARQLSSAPFRQLPTTAAASPSTMPGNP